MPVSDIRDNAIVRVMNDDGHVFQITAQGSASGVFNAPMSNAPSPPPSGGVPLSRERNGSGSGNWRWWNGILQFAYRGDCDLHNAWAWGLLEDGEFKAEAMGMGRRYEAARERYPHIQWDYTSKRLVPALSGKGRERRE